MSLFGTPSTVVGYARVAVERGLDRYPDGLTYAIEADLADLEPGARVHVPLGRGDTLTAGWVVERVEALEGGTDPALIKSIAQRDGSVPPLPSELLTLARWISGYTCSPIGMTLASMLPAAVKRNIGSVRRTMIDLAPEPPPDHTPTAKQAGVLEVLRAQAADTRPVELRRLADLADLRTTGPIKRLVDAGVLVSTTRAVLEAAWTEHAVDDRAAPALTGEQATVIDAIGGDLEAGFSSHLLFGVTASGKTEVYLRLIERVVAAGRVALMLVPEISLTPQTAGRLIGRFPHRRVAVLHSGLTSAQRHQQWAAVRDGLAEIVIGARSAVFAPVPDGRLGLVIVDEEHDGSYKQDQVPRYQGRDVAIRRGQIAAAPVVLGSATPSLESWHNATERGVHRLHRMTHRVGGMHLPTVRVVDFAQQRRARTDRRIHLLGPVLEEAIGRTLDDGGQVLVLLNRRGYANYITCPDQTCGWVMHCDDCDVTMVYHRSGAIVAGGFVQCHHCRAEQRLPAGCPDCGKRLSTFGFGTQRVEEELERKFPRLEPGRTMLRLDSDTMRSARDYYDALERFGSGAARVLVGTQMIAKGLDYPGVRLVGVVNADTAVHLPDFRATERTFQLVSQVAGRAGRGASAGTVIVQTFQPGMPAIALAAAHDYETFATAEIQDRRRLDLPPITRLARIVVRDEDPLRAAADARDLADRLVPLLTADVRLRGPAPCPIARIAGRHRHEVELIGRTAAALQSTIAVARSAGVLKAGARMAIDVDPVALM